MHFRCHKSWKSVNHSFQDNFRPRDCLDPYEFWISLKDFCAHFSDIVICSSPAASKIAEYDSERIYKNSELNDFTDLNQVQDSNETNGSNLDPTHNILTPALKNDFLCPAPLNKETSRSHEILVQENSGTIKMNNVNDCQPTTPKVNGIHQGSAFKERLFNHDGSRESQSPTGSLENLQKASSNNSHVTVISSVQVSSVKQMELERGSAGSPVVSVGHGSYPKRTKHCRSATSTISSLSGLSTTSSALSNIIGVEDANEADICVSLTSSQQSGLSDKSTSSFASLGGLAAATSLVDIQKTFATPVYRQKTSLSFNGRGSYRKRSELYQQTPMTAPPSPRPSSSCVSDSTCIFESKMDYFRPCGGWKEMLYHFGKWRSEYWPCFHPHKSSCFLFMTLNFPYITISAPLHLILYHVYAILLSVQL